MDGVSRTSLCVAAYRAWETERRGGLFVDRFARVLAGPDGFAAAEEIAGLSGAPRTADAPSMFALRTRFFDDHVLDAVTAGGIRQVVILGAGMDTRAFRLTWPAGTHLYEIDAASTFERKEPILGDLDARPRCERHLVVADLREEWCDWLLESGFAPAERTVWVVEGLIYYLPAGAAHRLLEDLATLSPPSSRIIVDVHHPMMRDLPALAGWRAALTAMGEQFLFFTEDGSALLADHGWDSDAYSVAEIGGQFGVAVDPVGSNGVRRLLSGRRAHSQLRSSAR